MSAHYGLVRPIKDSESKSLAPAYVKIIQSLGGRVRQLVERVIGQSMLTGEVASATSNPQGRGVGVDFSGPPFGSAWRHTMWSVGGIKEDVSGDWEGQQQVGTVDVDSELVLNVAFWNRPFAAGQLAPHSRCYLVIRVYKTTGTNASLTATYGYPDLSAPVRTQTVSVTSTNETTFEMTTAYWDVLPGLNRLRLTFTSDHGVKVVCASGVQRVKRTH